MSPIKSITFNNNTIPPSDDFNGPWDDLSPGTQEKYEKLAGILELIIDSKLWKKTEEPVTTCICITHNNERYFHPQCTSFHNVTAVGYVGGIPYKTQLFQGAWPHGTLVETYDDRCTQCKEFDNDGCPNCGPNTIRKVFDLDEDIGPCPYEDKLCPKCKLELKASPSGWSCINGHGY